ncbi:hypothetical protein [Streptomyces fructofermentans]|uniref:hypothetical protein n=1 Tax=Streptomyces fructofermentans TaxID=152141 RepID=UPI0016776E11|nr:hypothetical protein [Streptomyces fructofermentans]
MKSIHARSKWSRAPWTVPSDERGEHLDGCRVVLLGVPHDALESVDAAEPLGEVARREKLDRLDVPLGDLSFAGQLRLFAALLPGVLEQCLGLLWFLCV